VTLAAADWNVVLGALSELPWRIANPIITRIMGQVQPDEAEPAAGRMTNGDARGHEDAVLEAAASG
jgi:hypothetical protein